MRVAARDTDGLLFEVDDADAARLETMLGRFASLTEDGIGSFWSIEAHHDGRPVFGLVLGQKRYVLFTRNDDGSLAAVVKFSEHALAGSVADPPRLAGRDSTRKHRWARAVAEAAVEAVLAGQDPARAFTAPWDLPADAPFPAIARLQVSTPTQLAELARRGLVLCPFGTYLRAEVDRAFGNAPAPVAFDPGTDLAEWQELEWRDGDGRPVAVTTWPGKGALVLATLADKSRRWLRARVAPEAGPVDVVLVRRAGRAGAVIEAALVDPEVDASALRVRYDDEDLRARLQALVRELGPRAFARRSGLSRSAASRLGRAAPPSRTATERALAALSARAADEQRLCRCGRTLERPNARSCSKHCRDASYRERKATR